MIADFGLVGSARRLAPRGAARLRRVGRALRLRLPRARAVLAARVMRRTIARRCSPSPERSRRCSTATPRRRRSDGRGVGAGSGAPLPEPVVDPARRLRQRVYPRLRRRAGRETATARITSSPPRTAGFAPSTGTPRHWRRFVALLGDPEALAGPEWESLAFRLAQPGRDPSWSPRRSCARGTRSRGARRGAPARRPDGAASTTRTSSSPRSRRARAAIFRRTDFPHLAGAPFCAAPFRFSTLAVALDRAGARRRSSPCQPFAPRAPRRAVAREAAGRRSRACASSHLGVGAVGAGAVRRARRARRRGDQDRVAREPRLPAPRDVRARSAEPLLDVQRRVPRAARACASICGPHAAASSRCASAPRRTSWPRTTAAASSREWGLDYEHVRRVRPDVVYVSLAGLRPRRSARRSVGLRSAQLARSRALTCSGTIRDAPYPAGSSLNHPDHIAGKLGGGRGARGARPPPADRRGPAHRHGADRGGRVPGRRALPRGRGDRTRSARRGQRGRLCRVRMACTRARATTAGSRSRWSASAAWSAFRALAGLGGRAGAAHARRAARGARTRSSAARRHGRARATPSRSPRRSRRSGVSAMPAQSPDDQRGDAHLAARGAIVDRRASGDRCGAPHRESDSHDADARSGTRAPRRCSASTASRSCATCSALGGDEIAELVADGVCR